VTLDPSTVAVLTGTTRALVYGSAALVVGAAVFDTGVLSHATLEPADRAAARTRARRIAQAAAAVLLLGYAARFYIQVMDSFAVAVPTSEMVRQLFFFTRAWGLGMLAQLAIGASLFLSLTVVRRAASPPLAVVAIAAPLAALSVPLTGHAISHGGPVPLAVQAAHVFAVGSWLGTLAVLWVVCRKTMPTTGLVSIIKAFSPLALASAVMVAVAGTAAVFVHVGTPGDLVSTGYGLVLLVKIALFLAAASVGYVNWKHVTPELDRGGSRSQFTRAAALEIALGTVAILATALLTSLPQPGE
jgi:putative copper export protein